MKVCCLQQSRLRVEPCALSFYDSPLPRDKLPYHTNWEPSQLLMTHAENTITHTHTHTGCPSSESFISHWKLFRDTQWAKLNWNSKIWFEDSNLETGLHQKANSYSTEHNRLSSITNISWSLTQDNQRTTSMMQLDKQNRNKINLYKVNKKERPKFTKSCFFRLESYYNTQPPSWVRNSRRRICPQYCTSAQWAAPSRTHPWTR